jgi:hypothetical protein
MKLLDRMTAAWRGESEPPWFLYCDRDALLGRRVMELDCGSGGIAGMPFRLLREELVPEMQRRYVVIEKLDGA